MKMVAQIKTSQFLWSNIFFCLISDLVFATNNSFPCAVRQFPCVDNKQCIPISFTCDTEEDCSDGSDEDPAFCSKNATCDTNEFRCGNGQCIPTLWQCDNDKDCSDGSDEAEHTCQYKDCKFDEFTCGSLPGECIPFSWECDNIPDCSDASDERHCNRTCHSYEFTCMDGKCIPERLVCDLDNDCGDGSDEDGCAVVKCGIETEFQCDGGFCIPIHWRCDGEFDCTDGKDEQDCQNPESMESSCLPDEYECKDKMCIPSYLKCSGYPDCEDGSDETNCWNSARNCDSGNQFECNDGTCILLTQVCDGNPDCRQSEDEPETHCHKNECLRNNGGCSDLCVDTPVSYYCECHPGYELVDNFTCRDVNECEIPGSCSQICVNTAGFFKCACEDGYEEDHTDFTKCKAIEGPTSLLFARLKTIDKISLDQNEVTNIVNATHSAVALDFSFKTGMIFWSDSVDKRIYKTNIAGGKKKTRIRSNVTSHGLAIDWIYSHIYWTDYRKNTIELSNFDGGMHKVLLKDNLEVPRGIAVNPTEGWMFWTDWGNHPKIERSGMDGSHRETIVRNHIKWPNGITLDLVKKRVFWVDGKLNTLSSCDYDGRHRNVVLYSQSDLMHPFAITTFEDWIYWSDWDMAGIFKANKYTGKDVQEVTAYQLVSNPMAIQVYHSYRQPERKYHYRRIQKTCSHLRLPVPQRQGHPPLETCACPEYWSLLQDGITCERDDIETTPSIFDTTYYYQSEFTMTTDYPTKTTGESYIPTKESKTENPQVFISSILVIVIIGGVVVICLYYNQYVRHNMTSITFDNPVFIHKAKENQSFLANNPLQNRMSNLNVTEETQIPLTMEVEV